MPGKKALERFLTSFFRWLLSRGGYIKDNKKVLEVLTKKNLINIVKILQDYSRKQEVIDIDSEDEKSGKVVKCDDCGGEYLEQEKSAHIGSIPHQLANPTHLERQNPGFGIAEGNLGFRLLQRGGWDGRWKTAFTNVILKFTSVFS